MDILSFITELGISAVALASLAFFGLLLSSYVKIATVLAIVKLGLGFRSLPSAFVTGGLAICLSLLVMYPTLEGSAALMDAEYKRLGPNLTQSQKVQVVTKGVDYWKDFLKTHADSEEKVKFATIAHKLDQNAESKSLRTVDEYEGEFRTLAPAFLISELKDAFATGLNLFLPFLVIDLLVANILVAVGLNKISPVFVALPFKLLLFVVLDGWNLITSNLVETYIR